MTADDPGLVHRLAGEQALARGHRLLDPAALEAACVGGGLERDQFLAAVRDLAARGIIDVHFFGPSLLRLLRLTEDGLVQHVTATRRDLDHVRTRLATTLRAEADGGRLGDTLDLAGAVGEPSLLVEVLLDELRDHQGVVFSVVPGRNVRIHRVGPPADGPLRAG